VTSPAKLPHSRVFELLPWLVNGTLAGEERSAVEAHARACIACRRELKAQQRLHDAARLRGTADVSADAGFDRLSDRLDGTASSRRTWTRRYAAAAPFAIAAAAGIAVLALLVWFTPLPQLGDNTYSTLAVPPAGDAVLLDVVFAEATTAAEMQALLDEIGGEIIAGPSELGRYHVRLGEEREASAGLADLLDVLANDPRVRFAAPSLTEPQQ
jgi:hypothetical protein